MSEGMKELRLYAMLVGQEVGEPDKRVWVIAESEIEACEICTDEGHLNGIWVEFYCPLTKGVVPE
jgi:hypothetical protein